MRSYINADLLRPVMLFWAFCHDLLEPRELTVEEHALFSVWGTNNVSPQLVMEFDEFRENCNARYQYEIWKNDIDWNSFVIAGGSVTLSLLKQTSLEKASDVDLFFLKSDPKLFKEAVNLLENRLQNKYFVKGKTLLSNRLVQFELFEKSTIKDIFQNKSFSPSVIMQLIRPSNDMISISQIFHSFDLDVCAAAFNSKEVIISFACLQALNTDHTTCYAMPTSPSQYMRGVTRVLKYQRRGFNILYPKEFNMNAFLSTRIEDCRDVRCQRQY
ncbi:hypothetical protein I4U23_000073 [Adineta vaga]|nr:hypothetical protein I4U23_000073 [Adineta vaga]